MENNSILYNMRRKHVKIIEIAHNYSSHISPFYEMLKLNS